MSPSIHVLPDKNNASATNELPTNVVFATVAATICVAFKGRASILSIRPAAPIVSDPQMFHWSLEGRRAIYSSHNFR